MFTKTTHTKVLSVALIFILAISVGSYAEMTKFKVTAGGDNEVKFVSKAPLETVEGTTDQISGYVELDPENPDTTVSARFEVQMSTLETGNKTRDKHMRNNHLHTETFPTSFFTLTSIAGFPKPMPSSEEFKFKVTGDYMLHGISKPVTAEVVANLKAGSREISATAAFSVKLSDYEIPRPQFLVMKLDEKQNITVKFTAKAEN